MQFCQTGGCKHVFLAYSTSKHSKKVSVAESVKLQKKRLNIYGIFSAILLLLLTFSNTNYAQPPLSIDGWQIKKQGDVFISHPDEDSDFVYTLYLVTPFNGLDLSKVFVAFSKSMAYKWGNVNSCSEVKKILTHNPNIPFLNECNLSIQEGDKTSFITFMGYVKNGFLRYCSVESPKLNKVRKTYLKEARTHFKKILDYDAKSLPVTNANLWIRPAKTAAQKAITKDSLYMTFIQRTKIEFFDSAYISRLSDSIGRVMKYEQEFAVRTKETNKFCPNQIVEPCHSKNHAYYILIEKSKYRLFLCDSTGWLVSYPVVFGAGGGENKEVEGDRKTPEGYFHILSKRVHGKWDKFLAIDYPTKEDVEKFNKLKTNGKITKKAKIGGSIGIHGTWPHEDFVIDRCKNWTDGCISMKNSDIDELYNFVYNGMLVEIEK
jgi:lipoprotein-anchoring transpeptidase ErfK/SrfK